MAVLAASKSCPPVGAAVTCRAVAGKVAVEVSWGAATSLTLDSGKVGATTGPGASRCLARLVPALYGSGALQQTEVDHWLTFALGPLSCAGAELAKALTYLDSVLQPVTFLVGDAVTVADYEVFGALATSPAALWQLQQGAAPPSLARWWAMMGERPEVKAALAALPAEARTKPAAPQEQAKEAKEESAGGKFVELPGAVMGEVVVRFPPEASGYLHVGHAKAALLNNYYKESFKGKLVMRFDDTNPAKEKEEYEEVILEDLKLLQVKYDMFSRTSDHFETILCYCEKLLKEGKAYVDDTDAETMKLERDAKTLSKNWHNSPEKNLSMWEEMKKGSEAGTKCAVRAKIDMQSNNGCLRDPTIYRCKPEAHPATGTKYKVYPTYDFACPIVDSVEGVTHALRTTEYMDRDDQFNWFIDALGLRKPNIWAYARLNLTNTVMSKRKLTWLVDTGAVDGWDDPRLPTVRGVIRRGLTVEALQQFIIAQGSSRSVVFMEWDKIWAFNKKVLDPVVARHTTVDKAYRVPVTVAGASLDSHAAARHPKNPAVGEKQVWTGPDVLIDGADAEQLKVGENATFINWGNILIKKVNKGADGKVTSVEAEQNLDNKDYKKTLKLTWLCDDKTKSPVTPTLLIYYDHIISKAILDKDDDFKNFVGANTKHEVEMLGDPELRQLKKGEVVQVQRRGYFICDVPWAPYCQAVGRARPCVLLAIPDGTPTSYGPPGQTKAAPMPTKGAKEEKKGGQKKVSKAPGAAPAAAAGGDLGAAVAAQGDLVRKLKTEKAAKPEVDEAVKKLLALKAEYKAATGSDWKPGAAPAPAPASPAQPAGGDPGAAVAAQGDLVRKLKADKAAKPEVDEAVKKLLALKAEYKAATGSDWKPGAAPAAPVKAASPAPAAKAEGGPGAEAGARVAAQGELVRQLKADKKPKEEVEAAVKQLLALKAEFKTVAGCDWQPAGGAQPKKQDKKKEKKEVAKPAVPAAGVTRLGLEVKKEESLPDWYSQVLLKAEMMEYYDVSGCYILRPWSFAIWEMMKDFFDKEIKKLGVENCYFPIFVSQAALEREKEHIADFAPEVAWVTKSGDTALAEPIAIRPTSETVMYPAYAKWIQSHRDLPLKLNQWNNVVRWEFKHPQPFLRAIGSTWRRQGRWLSETTRLQVRSLASGQKPCALIIGAPGSGKGTISNWIVRDFGLTHVSSGDLLRAHLRDGTPLGQEAKSYIEKGDLVPDSVMVGLVCSELKKLDAKPWLLDGFPRTQPQAEALQAETPINVVVNLDVPFETIIDRIKDRWIHPGSGRVYNLIFNPPKVAGIDDETGEPLVQRDDDKPESVRNRLEVFKASTAPVLDYYREQGILADFQGTESKKIWPHVEKYLKTII